MPLDLLVVEYTSRKIGNFLMADSVSSTCPSVMVEYAILEMLQQEDIYAQGYVTSYSHGPRNA